MPPKRNTTLVGRFWSNVEKTPTCWIWTGYTTPGGYGRIGAGKRGIRPFATHLAWEWADGSPIPDGFHALHTCDNPPCIRNDERGFYEVNGIVRPRWGHLWTGTDADNVADKIAKGRAPIGDRHPSHLHPECLRRGDQHPSYLHPERLRRGERHGRAKLTEAQARAILALLARCEMTHAEIARQFGVTAGAIYLIAKRKNWAHLH